VILCIRKCLINIEFIEGIRYSRALATLLFPKKQNKGLTQPQQEVAPQALTEEEQLELMKRWDLQIC
jgi:hypothetical protein